MALYAQHGYGKGNKIESGLADRSISGVILSPKDEKMTNMTIFINNLRSNNATAEILFDPQFYASTIAPARLGKLLEYPYFRSNLTRRNFIAPTDLSTYVKETIDYQLELNLTKIISPTIILDDFFDQWSQTALSLAHEAALYHNSIQDAPPLLVSLCLNESALRNTDALLEFLDVISLLDVEGFYILIRREGTNQIEPNILKNMMYLCYTLSTINEYKVIVGYSNFIGIILHSVGASATSCGWFQGLKRFSLSRFQPTTGGRTPRNSYTSSKLLRSILIIPELTTIYNLGMIDDVISNNRYDHILRTNPTNEMWQNNTKCLHHWDVLNSIISSIENIGTINGKLDHIEHTITEAQNMCNRLVRAGAVFEQTPVDSHLIQWRDGIREFRIAVGV